MQFESRYRAGIADGSTTLTFRRWKRSQAIAGNVYRTAAGRIAVDDVRVVSPAEISDEEARRSGIGTAVELIANLLGTDDLPIYRVSFHAVEGPDPRDQLAAAGEISEDEFAAIEKRLARLDAASATGAWTARTLELIVANPTVRAGDLAPQMDQELLEFKLNVRKLKNLGLTLSLGTGYRISPRGQAFLAWRSNR